MYIIQYFLICASAYTNVVTKPYIPCWDDIQPQKHPLCWLHRRNGGAVECETNTALVPVGVRGTNSGLVLMLQILVGSHRLLLGVAKRDREKIQIPITPIRPIDL